MAVDTPSDDEYGPTFVQTPSGPDLNGGITRCAKCNLSHHIWLTCRQAQRAHTRREKASYETLQGDSCWSARMETGTDIQNLFQQSKLQYDAPMESEPVEEPVEEPEEGPNLECDGETRDEDNKNSDNEMATIDNVDGEEVDEETVSRKELVGVSGLHVDEQGFAVNGYGEHIAPKLPRNKQQKVQDLYNQRFNSKSRKRRWKDKKIAKILSDAGTCVACRQGLYDGARYSDMAMRLRQRQQRVLIKNATAWVRAMVAKKKGGELMEDEVDKETELGVSTLTISERPLSEAALRYFHTITTDKPAVGHTDHGPTSPGL